MSQTSLLIDKTGFGTNCLWKIITSKWIAKYTCLGVTLLLLLISVFMCYLTYVATLGRETFYLDLFIGEQFRQLQGLYSVLAVVILILAVYGVFAVLTENTTFVRWYGVLTFLLFILTATTGGTLFATGIQKCSETYFKFSDLMEMYELDSDAEMTIDFIQNDKHCCGHYGPSDWLEHLTVNTFRNFSDFVAPKSCCYNQKCTSYNSGCENTIKLIIMEALAEVLVASSILSIIFLLAVLTTFRLKQKIEKSKEAYIQPRVLVSTIMQPELNTVDRDFENDYDYSVKVQKFANILQLNGIN